MILPALFCTTNIVTNIEMIYIYYLESNYNKKKISDRRNMEEKEMKNPKNMGVELPQMEERSSMGT